MEYRNTWITGDWIGHLWFLIVLLLYTAVAIILYKPLQRACRRFAANPRHALWILLAFPVLSIAVHAVARPSTAVADPFYGSISLHTLVTYLPYYLCGLALYHWRNFEPSALRAWPALLVATIIWAALRGAVFSWPAQLAPLHALLRLLLPWLLVCWILLLFARYADRPTPVSRFIADSSYTVYLFHHLAVILLASALLNAPWNPFAKFAVK